MDVTEEKEQPKVETLPDVVKTKLRWAAPTIEDLPLAMTLNSVSGAADGPYSQLS